MKAVLFDMDGVLILSENFYIEETYNCLKQMGFKGTYEDVTKIVGFTLDKAYDYCVKLLENTYSLEEVKKHLQNHFIKTPVDYRDLMNDGALSLMQFLKEKGVLISVCSSSPRDNIDYVLNVCGFLPYVDYVISGEAFKESKPNPEIYLHAAEVLGVPISECLVIEDSTVGIQAGKSAGMRVYAIKDQHFNMDQTKADKIFMTMNEVRKAIENLL